MSSLIVRTPCDPGCWFSQHSEHSQNLARHLNDYIKVRERWTTSSQTDACESAPSVGYSFLLPRPVTENPEATLIVNEERNDRPAPGGQENMNIASLAGPSSLSKREDESGDIGVSYFN
jgi:hypothetical protein